MRLALGTAQFGLSYGVANRTGQVALDEAAAILGAAREAGIDTLDTAIAYGSSEARLGELGVSGWRIVSKLPALPDDCADVEGVVFEAVCGSLARLRVEGLHGLLLHRPSQLLGPRGDELFAALMSLRAQGLVSAVGVSIYAPSELDRLWPRFRFDLVQAPYSVVDRRIETSGWLGTLARAGVEVHVRSAFLQGLLLMPATERPAFSERWAPLWSAWDTWVAANSVTQLHACLAFALSRSEVERVVVGVDSVSQLREILGSIAPLRSRPPIDLASDDEDLLHPSRWPTS